MSGGEFNYVSVAQDIGELAGKLEELERLRDALAEYPGSEVAVEETNAFIETLRELEQALRAGRLSRLQYVWKAVEWHHSSDWTENAVLEAIQEHREGMPKQDGTK